MPAKCERKLSLFEKRQDGFNQPPIIFRQRGRVVYNGDCEVLVQIRCHVVASLDKKPDRHLSLLGGNETSSKLSGQNLKQQPESLNNS